MKKHVYVGTIAEICLKIEKDINSFGRCTVAEYIRDKEHEARVMKSFEIERQRKLESIVNKLAVKIQVLDEYAIEIDLLNEKIMNEKRRGGADLFSLTKYREQIIELNKKEITEKIEKQKLEKELEAITNERS